MSKWKFFGTDSNFEKFSYTITAADKQAAIKKGLETLAKKRGEYSSDTHCWECKLVRA